MTIRRTMVFTRPSTDVAWSEPINNSSSLESYITTNFIDTNKLQLGSVTVSEDSLTRTVITDFANSAAMTEFQKDSTVQAMLTERDNYNIENSITITASNEEI